MNVLVCAACGRRLSPPLRLLPELPERPPRDGRKLPDGSRHAPSTVPQGVYSVDPEPSGAPFVPHPDPDWMGAAVPGTVVLDFGRCGPPGRQGPNFVCPGCGAAVATLFADCSGPYETHFLPDAARTVPA
ncbi:hypothetical protein ACQPXS_31935 [Streptomyces sp. CA-142005]|uniref:hypothetical protein n=1 Tax=Streptomyces sp. CA-142005 TaxID=3240052 RepID=UPI003D9476B0